MKSGETTVYIITTEDPQYSVFIIPMALTPFSNYFNIAKDVLGKLEKSEFSEEIWLPNFEISGEKSIEELCGSTISSKSIGVCKEIFKFKLFSALHPEGSLVMTPEKNSIVIDKSFIFGMIHQKIDEELEIPLYAIDVHTQHFRKYNEELKVIR